MPKKESTKIIIVEIKHNSDKFIPIKTLLGMIPVSKKIYAEITIICEVHSGKVKSVQTRVLRPESFSEFLRCLNMSRGTAMLNELNSEIEELPELLDDTNPFPHQVDSTLGNNE